MFIYLNLTWGLWVLAWAGSACPLACSLVGPPRACSWRSPPPGTHTRFPGKTQPGTPVSGGVCAGSSPPCLVMITLCAAGLEQPFLWKGVKNMSLFMEC